MAPLHLASGFLACSFGVLFVSVETPPPLLILFQDKYVKVSIMLAILPRKEFKPAATIVSAMVKSKFTHRHLASVSKTLVPASTSFAHLRLLVLPRAPGNEMVPSPVIAC